MRVTGVVRRGGPGKSQSFLFGELTGCLSSVLSQGAHQVAGKTGKPTVQKVGVGVLC